AAVAADPEVQNAYLGAD
ncbi:MAG: hypothetical protein AB7S99_24330, partial [Pseudodonghicola sp.]